MTPGNSPAPFDSLLIVSFGGPEKREDVMPFLQNVTRGRNIPTERLEAVAEHYYHFGGKSPINDQMRALQQALEEDFEKEGIALPIYLGNRNWTPTIPEALKQLAVDGRKRTLAFIVSAYSSYSGCRQYRENLQRALTDCRELASPPEIVPLRRFFNHPDFVAANVARVTAAIEQLRAQGVSSSPRLVFTAHSIPQTMASGCDYELQLREVAQLVADQVPNAQWDLVWQSRSGPPQVPWLEPDILDHLRSLKRDQCPSVVIAPIGFLSDHMEVAFDLDVEARELCEQLHLPMVRAGSVGTHAHFIRCIRRLVEEQIHGAPPLAVGTLPPRAATCATDCCPAPVRLSRRPGSAPAQSAS